MSRRTTHFFMRKLSILLILFILNIGSFFYLKKILSSRNAFEMNLTDSVYIVPIKDIILDDKEDFCFEDYFLVFSMSEYSYLYTFDDQYIYININGRKCKYPYSIKEKEKEIVETIVYHEVYIDRPPTETIQETVHEVHYDDDYEDEYFELSRENCFFSKGTDLNHIISEIHSYVSSNMRITVDYSELNPNESGVYPVFFMTDSQKRTLFVEIG